MGLYNWEKLPSRERQRVEKALELNDWDELLDIYYEYALGKTRYCCPFEGMAKHFKHALDNGLI